MRLRGTHRAWCFCSELATIEVVSYQAAVIISELLGFAWWTLYRIAVFEQTDFSQVGIGSYRIMAQNPLLRDLPWMLTDHISVKMSYWMSRAHPDKQKILLRVTEVIQSTEMSREK